MSDSDDNLIICLSIPFWLKMACGAHICHFIHSFCSCVFWGAALYFCYYIIHIFFIHIH